MGGAATSGATGFIAGTSTPAGFELSTGGGAARAAGREGGGCIGVDAWVGGGRDTPGLVPY